MDCAELCMHVRAAHRALCNCAAQERDKRAAYFKLNFFSRINAPKSERSGTE